jgi:hypothetical protein
VICGAKTRSGRPCQKFPVTGRARCRLHGGASKRGEEHWNYKHGGCTNEARQIASEARHQVKVLEHLMRELGMIDE